ncbi:MAG: 2-hydroxyacyl-CoA dehydratase [Deltaproteobacteria bacterium]|nr:2-hydroxyacyl-CoA dehydratase [Deltaproteobacteria bacterium]
MANNVHEDFLRLTGFEEEEMAEYLPEWRKASEKLGLTEEDVRFAVQERLPAHFALELEGIRKLLGCFVKETIDLTKAIEYKRRGTKIVYGILPAILHFYYALKLTAPDKVFVSFPDIFITFVMNSFFHKLAPYLEEAEKTGIPYGCRHCALNKTRYAIRRLGIIPSPDINWIWGFICDEAPKTDEFIQLYHDPEWKTYVTRLPHDQPLGTVEDEVIERVEYLADQMRDGFESVQKEIGIKVPEEKIKEVIEIWQKYAAKVSELGQLMSVDPQPLNAVSGRFFWEGLFTPFNTGIESMEKALDIALREVKERVNKKEGILPQGAPKLLIYSMHPTVPWIAKMFEENGVGIPLSEFFILTKKQLRPSSFEDPYMAAAESWLRTSGMVNPGYQAEQICEKITTHKFDGMVFGLMDFDRWLGSSHRILGRMVEEKTRLPVFYIEGDNWEDRDYSPEALRTRIESICEIMKIRKA